MNNIIWLLTLLLVAQLGLGQDQRNETEAMGAIAVNQSALALFERIKALDGSITKLAPSSLAKGTIGGDLDDEDNEDDQEDDEDEEEDEDDEDNEVDDDDDDIEVVSVDEKDGNKVISDIFGNKLKMEQNRTLLIKNNKARDLGLIAIKAIILGPLIGLTIKAALIRGLIWAVLAYVAHLFFPGLLSALGLGTGLVGFARQSQPSLAQMLLPALAHIPSHLHSSLPSSFRSLTGQYRQMFVPVIESIRAIPEGHCRFRAVCETASQLIKNSQFMSSTLQRLSATLYLNFGTDYSRAWLDGIVQSDCAAKYSQCPTSPLTMVANKLAETTAVAPIIEQQQL